MATEGDPENARVRDIEGTLYTCSYDEEVEAMKLAADWIAENMEAEQALLSAQLASLCAWP